MQNNELDKYLKNFFNHNYADFISAAAEPRSLRVNTLKSSLSEIKALLDRLNIAYEPLPFNECGFIEHEGRHPLSQTLEFFSGKIQYQGIASQLPAIVLNPLPGERILDMAAAPGSKSTQLAALMENRGVLILNDFSTKRMQPLNTNLQKSGAVNAIVLNLNGERFGNLMPNYFDKILLDAPCTALGALQKNIEVADWWNHDKLRKLVNLQKRLIISAFKALKPGGTLVYSTCSIAPEENEMVIQALIEQYPAEIVPVKEIATDLFNPGLAQTNNVKFHPDMVKTLRTYPHQHGMEGFFIVKLRKTGEQKRIIERKQAALESTLTCNDPAVYSDLKAVSDTWGIPETLWQDYRFIRTRDRIWMVAPDIERVPKEGYCNAGILLAEEKWQGWKMFNAGVQLFGDAVTRRRIGLDAGQMRTLFAYGSVSCENIANGYHALEWQGKPLAVVYADTGNLRLRMQHPLRLPEVF